MISVQQLLFVLFVGALVITYRAQVLSIVKNLFSKYQTPAPAQQSVALRVVNDIISVTELRDKLSAENCPQGVEACTNLLRVIVEHQIPSQGAV